MMLDGPPPTTPEGNSVLVVMAHPDDAEFGCGGTIAKWAAAGKEINYVLCTSGDKGSSDPDISPIRLAQTRRAEQINAAHALGRPGHQPIPPPPAPPRRTDQRRARARRPPGRLSGPRRWHAAQHARTA